MKYYVCVARNGDVIWRNDVEDTSYFNHQEDWYHISTPLAVQAFLKKREMSVTGKNRYGIYLVEEVMPPKKLPEIRWS